MITATVTDIATGSVVQTIAYSGPELFLGCILGALAGVVVWSTLKSFAK